MATLLKGPTMAKPGPAIIQVKHTYVVEIRQHVTWREGRWNVVQMCLSLSVDPYYKSPQRCRRQITGITRERKLSAHMVGTKRSVGETQKVGKLQQYVHQPLKCVRDEWGLAHLSTCLAWQHLLLLDLSPAITTNHAIWYQQVEWEREVCMPMFDLLHFDVAGENTVLTSPILEQMPRVLQVLCLRRNAHLRQECEVRFALSLW